MVSRVKTSLPSVEFIVATGNFDTSRTTIDRIIIHTTVGTANSAIERFGAYGTQVSAHYIVGLDGTLYHGLQEFLTAYHAGDYAMNQRSIGIEHADNGDYNGVRPDILYSASAKLVADICQFYLIPIDRTRILKHSEIIATSCPDALDIDRIVKEAANIGPMANITRKELDLIRTDRDNNWNAYEAVLAQSKTFQKNIEDLNNQINDLKTQNQSLMAQVSALQQKLATINPQATQTVSRATVTSGIPSVRTPSNETLWEKLLSLFKL